MSWLSKLTGPAVGPMTKRTAKGLTAADWAYTQRQTEKWFGPFNPRTVPDWVLKLMGTDWSIGFAREIWLSAFHAVDYRVEGGTKEARSFIDSCLQRHLWQWIEVLLRALDYGRQACELVWALDADGRYVLEELRDLDPEITEILEHLDTGDYRGLRYGGKEISGSKTLLVTNEPEFGGLLGKSLNARAYNPWWWGNLVYFGLNRYLERKGDPPLIGFAPGEEVSDDAGNVQDPVKVTAVGLANLRSGGAYVFPQEYDAASKQPLYAVRALEIAARAPEFLSTIDRYEQNKKIAWLIPGSLGSGSSFASDKVSQQLLHRMFDRRLQRIILDPINKHVIPKLVRYNGFSGEMPRLAAGSMAENAREVFAELLRSALNLEGIAPDGRSVRIAQMIDWAKGLRTLNLPKVDASLFPDLPTPPIPPSGAAGRPPRIRAEEDVPNAPSRPGLLSLSSQADTPEAWVSGVQSALNKIDEVIWETEKLVEAERVAVEAEIRNLLTKAISRAKKTDSGDLDQRNRTLAAELGRDVQAVLENSMFADLMDESEVHMARGPRSPLAIGHIKAAEAARGALEASGNSVPSRSQTTRKMKDVARDGRSNARGTVIRETRRVTETLDRAIIGGADTQTAETIAETYVLPSRDFRASTVDHVRATARAILTWADKEAEAFLTMLSQRMEAQVIDDAPRGVVSPHIWTIRSAKEIDTAFQKMIASGKPVTSWKNLGLTFGSPEQYVPIPRDLSFVVKGKAQPHDFSLALLIAYVEKKRREWNERVEQRQRELDELYGS